MSLDLLVDTWPYILRPRRLLWHASFTFAILTASIMELAAAVLQLLAAGLLASLFVWC